MPDDHNIIAYEQRMSSIDSSMVIHPMLQSITTIALAFASSGQTQGRRHSCSPDASRSGHVIPDSS